MKFLAVQGLSLEPQGIVSGGTLSITSTPSTKVMAGGSGAYSGGLTFTLVGANASGYDPGTVATAAPVVIPPTAIKTLVDGQPAMRVDDGVPLASMTGLISGTPTPFFEPWEITDAGQDKVRGD